MRRRKPAVITINREFIPTSVRFGNKIIPIISPVYHTKAELKINKPHPFVELPAEGIPELQELSEKVLHSGDDKRYTFLNSALDYINPAPSAIRIYVNPEDFMHIQVRKIPESDSIFQLDYFETNPDGNTPDLLMIVLVEINSSKVGFKAIDLVYASPRLIPISEDMPKDLSDLEYASRIASLFRSIQIYMRPWVYEESMSSNDCVVMPVPVLGRSYTTEYPTNLPEF